MDKSLLTNKNIIKYLLIGGLIYVILKTVPSQQLTDKDMILMLLVIFGGFMCIDCLIFKNKEGFVNEENKNESEMTLNNVIPQTETKKRVTFNLPTNPNMTSGQNMTTNTNFQDEQLKSENAQNTTMPNTTSTRNNMTTQNTNMTVDNSAQVAEAIKQVVMEAQPKKDQDMKYDPNDWNKPAQTNCDFAIENVKKQFEREINELKDQLQTKIDETSGNRIANRYLESLLIELNENELLDLSDIENIKIKLKSRLLTIDEVIASLEKLKKEGKGKIKPSHSKSKDDREYNELPADLLVPIGDKIANEWADEYSILSTDKWKVPMPRPPVCINNSPCKVCPTDSSNYPVSLMRWDDSRKVSQTKMNKEWAMNQANAHTN